MAKHDNWSTPPDLMATLHDEFHFDCEVCAAADNRAIPNVPYMGLDNGKDATIPEWDGQINYCNPPYSMLPVFVKAANNDAFFNGHTNVMLIPLYCDTAYWQQMILKEACEVRLLAGRLRFWEDGKPGKDTARFPSALVIFKHVKGLIGCNIRPWHWKEQK